VDDERRTFIRALIAIAVGGLVLRVAYVLVFRQDAHLEGDSIHYHLGATLLAEGEGFIAPLAWLRGVVVESADHPPLYLLWLTLPSLVGLSGQVWHMLWTCVLGAGTVAVTGLVGREVAGPRVGLIAAGLAAIYPNIWSHDGILQSESMAIFTVALVLLLAYRYWRQPSLARILWLGAACGLAALARSELLLLVPFVLLPLVLITHAVDLRQRIKWLVVGGCTSALVLAPWVGYNLTRFEHPVFLSTGFEITLLTASCDMTYYGPYTGYWSFNCGDPIGVEEDQSVRAIAYRKAALDYISDNKARVPVVVLARWGRVTGLFRPIQQVDLENDVEGREIGVAWASLLMFYPIAGLAIVGGVVLRRRRVPVFPLAALPAIALIAVTLTFGQNRYRAMSEGALVVLAAVAIDVGLRRLHAGRRRAVAGDAADVAADRADDRVLTRP
jgi:4-amino-4-deoxy-L-arabinose transferase-like glycosyltransferase